ncbi:hypothetical protein COV93_08165 [Candidatus Woesearchaeota archaeon CG11_big_fil_rev_8_21_14_0_20_43_8]|nr:MAG: hypothetical protein COV93_08165 [Candidatus Woesearchaeota archaeon CG11_big_fil_rev_8_21_14_0_20_43_8]
MARNKGVQKRLHNKLEHQAKEQPTEKIHEHKSEDKVNNKKQIYNMTGLKGFYIKYLKYMMVLPIILLVLAVAQIGYQYSTTGEFFAKDVSLAGGLSITIHGEEIIDIPQLESLLGNQFGKNEITIRELRKQGVQFGAIIEASSHIDERSLIDVIEQVTGELKKDDYSIEQTGSSLGESFLRQLVTALVLAFVFMGIVVLLYFRTFVPSFAVILAAVSDIIETLAIVNLLGMKLSSAGIAAFLMLIGYSVDTDILLSTRVLKNKEGNVYTRLFSSMKPGMLMSMTTLTVVTIGLFLSQSDTLKQIMMIIFIGLLLDLVNTWIQNAGILAMYAEKKERELR